MKKIMLGAAILFSGVLQAAVTLDSSGKVVVNPSDTYEIYLAGSSNALNFIEHILTNVDVVSSDHMCDINQPIVKFQDNGSGEDQNAYYCTLNQLNPQLAGLAAGKTNLLIYKRSRGGSAEGVVPIIDEAKGASTASISFLSVDPQLCTAPSPAITPGAVSTSTCDFSDQIPGHFQSHVPDFGISDLDPKQFRGANTRRNSTAVNPNDVSTLLTVEPVVTQVFGIAVTLKLRNALQEVQFPTTSTCNPKNAGYTTGGGGAESVTCMPNLARYQVASILAGKIDSWKDLKIGGSNLYDAASAANKPGNANARVHICTGNSGSGAKAQLGIKFLNYPCDSEATNPKDDTGTLNEVVPTAQVHAMWSAKNLSECLRELDAGVNTIGTGFNNTYTAGGSRWAVGIQGLEKNANLAENWRFVKIDSFAPTLENVVEGKYQNWAEMTFQYSKTHAWDTSEDLIVKEFIKVAGNPSVIVSLNATSAHPFGDSGYLASPKNFTPDVNGNFVSNYPVNPYSHATTVTGVNNCRIPTVYDLSNAAAGVQLQ